jgi:hypothetical protein
MEIVIANEAPILKQTEVREGNTIRQILLAGDTPEGINFRLFRSQYRSGEDAFESPRHHHAFQQIRWAESGAVNYGPDMNIPEGDIAYFPRGTYYGPQRKDAGIGLLLQFGFDGEHQSGPRWDAIREDAIKKLKARGTLEKGVFTDTDPLTGRMRQRDAALALYEERYIMQLNKPFPMPMERYKNPILMHARSFEYFQSASGVEMKHLGHFFDHPGRQADVRISMIRLSGGAHRLGKERSQVGWAKSPGLQLDGRLLPEMSCFYGPSGEDLTISGTNGVEVFLVEFPRLD